MDARLTKKEIETMLATSGPQALERLFRQARAARQQHFGNRVFLYGFVYFSTWCKNNCNFCYYRRQNNIERYRKSPEEVVRLAGQLVASGVHLIDLTMGEDPEYLKEGFASVLNIARRIKKDTGVPVMVSPGVVADEVLDACAEAGVDWYALYQETHNRVLFATLRADQDYDRRMHAKLAAAQKGMLIEEGILSGVGERVSDIADSILRMGEIGASQMRVMSFVPQKGSPMEHLENTDHTMELKIIAAMRLCYPGVLIPASLDVDGIEGLSRRIDAGANVVTSIIPPATGLAGVAQGDLDVDEGGRTVAQVAEILDGMGMQVAPLADYQDFLNAQKAAARP